MTIKSLYPASRPSLDLNFAKLKRLDPRITFTRASTGTYVGSDGLIKSAAVDEARFDHDPATGESLGLLVEEARTNNCTYSNYPHLSPWVSQNTFVVPNATIAPDGTYTAAKVVETATAGNHSVYRPDLFTSTGAANRRSIYVKPAERRYVILGIAQSGVSSTDWIFDAQTGAFFQADGFWIESPTAINIGDGWWRISWHDVQFNGIYDGLTVGIANGTGAANKSYTGDGTSGIYIWGAQLEPGASFPTSYIPTPATFTSRASTATYYDSAGTVQTAASGVARSAAFFPDSNGVMRPAGLLLEAAGTNLVTYSEQFDQWVSSYVSVSSNAVAAPDGTTTADTVVADGSSNAHWIWTSDPTLGPKTFSVFAKAGTGGFLQLLFAGDSNPYANFNLSTGAIGSVGTTSTASIQKLANGWYRCSLYTSSSIATSPYIGLITSATAVRAEANTLSTSVHLWGAQVEQSPYPTSYIPTVASTVTRSADTSSSATVTRSADVASITGTNFSGWWNSSSGSFLFAHQSPTTPSTSTYFYLITAGTGGTTNGYRITSLIFPADASGGNAWSNTTSWLTTGLTTNESAKLAFGFTNGSAAAVKNGVVQETNTENLAAVAPTTLSFASNVTATISRLTYWPIRLSDATLQALTAS